MGWGLWVGCLAPCTQHPPRLPLLAVLLTQAQAPKPAGHLKLTSFHADARQSWQLLGSRTARNVISKCWGDVGGGCGALGSRCKGDGRGAPVPPVQLLGSGSPKPLVPQPSGRFASALSPLPPPRTPRLGAHREAPHDPALLCFADNLFSGIH